MTRQTEIFVCQLFVSQTVTLLKTLSSIRLWLLQQRILFWLSFFLRGSFRAISNTISSEWWQWLIWDDPQIKGKLPGNMKFKAWQALVSFIWSRLQSRESTLTPIDKQKVTLTMQIYVLICVWFMKKKKTIKCFYRN